MLPRRLPSTGTISDEDQKRSVVVHVVTPQFHAVGRKISLESVGRGLPVMIKEECLEVDATALSVPPGIDRDGFENRAVGASALDGTDLEGPRQEIAVLLQSQRCVLDPAILALLLLDGSGVGPAPREVHVLGARAVVAAGS